jgi:hypothetical protein
VCGNDKVERTPGGVGGSVIPIPTALIRIVVVKDILISEKPWKSPLND